ncbi:60S ribosomal protein L27, mitochondrial [Cladophialophora chaetospira]|uniref:60S ribosomal protein L27, mitochondrial n=1 Tax=Cladophialophora chaetospira TaxID=386627 RepID=A0AA38XIS5_9EURO|nr:60S ribosomal protein L27, mitochondrial [Cladophialophora chaetospira]
MVKPSPALFGRMRFTTKQVGRGFYRGNRTGSMGAHTEYGKYMIDWRKTKYFNVPDLKDFALSPFITQVMDPTPRIEERPNGEFYTPEKVDGLEFLRSWKNLNPYEYDNVVEGQRKLMAEATADGQIENPASEQIEEPVQEPIYTQSSESERNPFQQQTRQMHTSSRRLEPAQESIPSDLAFEYPSTKRWLDMSREERKALINTATTVKLRELKKTRAVEALPKDVKQKVKGGIKYLLKQELIGSGIYKDRKEYDAMMHREGRERAEKGLPRRTSAEKEDFLMDILQKNGDADAALKRILAMPAAEFITRTQNRNLD